MIKASECVRQGCLHVQSEACLTQEKVPSQGVKEVGLAVCVCGFLLKLKSS